MSRLVFSLLLAAMLGGCATSIPEAALRLPESTLEVRSIQTRTLAAPSEIYILTATISVLQDMEFNIERIEKPLGVITASKVTDADSGTEKMGLMLLDVLCVIGALGGSGGGCDAMSTAQDDQHITLTMVVLPSLARSGEYTARITIQRVIYDKMDRIKVLERIDDTQSYQQIFDNLRKSLFIQVSAT
jgi:hypothetical protein